MIEDVKIGICDEDIEKYVNGLYDLLENIDNESKSVQEYINHTSFVFEKLKLINIRDIKPSRVPFELGTTFDEIKNIRDNYKSIKEKFYKNLNTVSKIRNTQVAFIEKYCGEECKNDLVFTLNDIESSVHLVLCRICSKNNLLDALCLLEKYQHLDTDDDMNLTLD